MASLLIRTSRLESQTWDEAIHISAGVSYWRTGDYRMNHEHPVLPKLLCAVPLLFTSVRLNTADESWKSVDQVAFARKFLYENSLRPQDILLLSRLATMGVCLLLGGVIAFWVRHRFGDVAALVALALYVFDPNVLAHGRYVTTDTWVAAFSFIACVTWCEALLRGGWRWYLLAGVALGLALGTKFSALYLGPVFLVLALFRRPNWRWLPVAGAAAFVVLCLPYAPEIKSALVAAIYKTPIQEPYLSMPLAVTADNHSFLGDRLHHLGKALNLPSFSYLVGLAHVADHVKGGHWGYLLGEASTEGWWYYFPVAFAVKTPLATLAACLVALVLMVWKRPRPRFEVMVLLLPFLVWWGFAISSRLNLGLRHILPVYPFLFVMVAVAMVRMAPKFVWMSIVTVLVVECAFIYPHYLAFFNAAVGGPGNGPLYLLDSNIDWGQDSYKLKAWVDEREKGAPVCSAYFGQAYAGLVGLNEAYMPRYNELKQQSEMDCYAAASVTLLYSGYSKDDDLRHLRKLQPMAKIGYSIYVYDFRKHKASQ